MRSHIYGNAVCAHLLCAFVHICADICADICAAAPPCVHFLTLSHDEQAAAIRRLAAAGYGDHAIAAITGWHVIEVRRALAAHRERIDFTYAR